MVKRLFVLLAISLITSSAFALRFTSNKIITAGDMSAATITSSIVDLSQINYMSLQAIYTGSPVGSLEFQVSADAVPLCSSATHWTPYQAATSVSAAGATLLDVATGFHCLRVLYTKISGTGALNVSFNGKD